MQRKGRIGKEEIPGSKRNMYGYILTYSRALKGERLSSVFSPGGTLISASAAPHCGVIKRKKEKKVRNKNELFDYNQLTEHAVDRTLK